MNMFPSTGNCKMQSAARPDRYVTYINGKIVANDEMEGPTGPDEWHVKLHEGSLFTFESVRDGEFSGLYITVEGTYLILSEDASFFTFQESPISPTWYTMGIPGTSDVWSLSASFNLAPIIIQTTTDSTTELWAFRKI